MSSQRKVDRDAAVAVLERVDDVPPQIMIGERAGDPDAARETLGQALEPMLRALVPGKNKQ